MLYDAIKYGSRLLNLVDARH